MLFFFLINHYIKWPKAALGSLEIWKVKLFWLVLSLRVTKLLSLITLQSVDGRNEPDAE